MNMGRPKTMDTPTSCLIIFTSLILTIAADPGTTPGLESIFIGRCTEYKQIVYPVNGNWLIDEGFSQSLDCAALYDQFLLAFENKDPCALEDNAFEAFVSSISQTIPQDIPLFWSGTNTLAHRFGLASTLKTMEDTLIGYLMNNLNFCGSTTGGLNLVECPQYGNCPDGGNEVRSTFWDTASKSFASRVNGDITVLLSGSNADGAYRNYSTFARIEVPNLIPESVNNIRIIVSHDIGKTNPIHETCDDGSLLQLKSDLDARGIAYTCEDDPLQVTFVQCSSDVFADECMSLTSDASGPIKMPLLALLSLISLAKKLY